jgi:hypothetical protein
VLGGYVSIVADTVATFTAGTVKLCFEERENCQEEKEETL